MTTHNVAQRPSAGEPERLWCQVVKPDATGVAMHPALDLGDAVLVSMHPVDELTHDNFQTAFAVGQWWLQAWADTPGAMVVWQNNEWGGVTRRYSADLRREFGTKAGHVVMRATARLAATRLGGGWLLVSETGEEVWPDELEGM